MIVIYALRDCDDQIRYVGKSNDFARRWRQHMNTRSWVRKFVILEVDPPSWQHAETWWIKHLRHWGCQLENRTNGGDEWGIIVQTPELRAKKSAAGKIGGKAPSSSPAQREAALKWSEKGHVPEARAKAAAAMSAKWADPEYRARVAAKISAAKSTPEARAKQAEAGRKGGKGYRPSQHRRAA